MAKVVTRFPHKVRKIETLWIPMPDGCRLAATVWLPEDADSRPVPAILEYIPYRRRDFTAGGDALHHPYYAGHGYAAVRVDQRGSGDSGGLILDEYTPQELADGADAIAWIACQPWCTGLVGMMGISWGGFNALQVAALRPPALKAIMPVAFTDDRYADDIHFMGGCLLNDNLMWGSTFSAFCTRPPDPAIVGDRWRTMWLERLANAPLLTATWLGHQRRDAYWRHGSVIEDYGAIQAAVYAVGGWADGYSNAVPRLLAGLEGPRKGIIGPWAHTYPWSGVPGPAIGFLQESLRWWDHWLKGIDTGIMDEPMLRVWMQDAVPPRTSYDHRPGRWVAERTWTGQPADPTRYAINADGLAAKPGREVALTHASPESTGLGGQEWCPYGFKAEHATDQREDDGKALAFDTAPLKRRTEILGAPRVTLDLAIDQPQGIVAVRLDDVAPDGASTLVTYGVLNLTHRESHEHPTPVRPGQRLRVRVQLNDIAYAFPAGHRIRVAISTNYWPLLWPAAMPVLLTLFAGSGELALPVRKPRPEDRKLRAFPPPETAAPLARTMFRPYQRQRRVSVDHGTGTHVMDRIKDRGHYVIHDTGTELDSHGTERYTIVDGTPLSARAEATYSIAIRRGDWAIKTVTTTTVTATADSFLVTAQLDAYEVEVRIFSRTWSESIAREMV